MYGISFLIYRMTSVKVAVRVRPINKREEDSEIIIDMDGCKTRIKNPKVPEVSDIGDHGRDILKQREFTFDHSFWSARETDPNFVQQQQVFEELGLDVVSAAYEGYNVCVFAYGQTGSGKTYTMMGSEDNPGLIPRFCAEMFQRMNDPNSTYRTQVSYLEIYNERVRDLLKYGNGKPIHNLRIREHPKEGPYVQDLSEHTVVSYESIAQLMQRGNMNRTTASTLMNTVSSRSHAIFTITFTQAKFEDGLPSERQSKIHLVDLAGSERADASGATGQRLKEGGSINRSLVTLGNVISVLAEASSQDKGSCTRGTFIPYRDSVLTWLLKDSLGGNAKTIMVATISPAGINYAETLSTLRYANRAKNIINRPTVNEDANVRLIRELREEIARLKALLGGNPEISTPKMHEKLHENEARIKVLTEEWAGKWRESASILKEEKNLELRKEGVGVVLDSTLPHLITVDDDILSTGITLFHLKEGITTIGTEKSEEPQDIFINGEDAADQHCVIEYRDGVVTLHPIEDALCIVNRVPVTEPVRLTQGAVIILGKNNMFRFNHPAEARKLKQMRKSLSTLSLSKSPLLSSSRTSLLSHSLTDLYRSNDSLHNHSGKEQRKQTQLAVWEFEETHREEQEMLDSKRQEIEEMEERCREQEKEWQQQQADLQRRLHDKEQQLADMQDRLQVFRETLSPVKSIEEALRRLEDQEQKQLIETRLMKEEIVKEMQDMEGRYLLTESSISLAVSQLDQQMASRQVQVSALQEECVLRCKVLQDQLNKEEEQASKLKSELTSLREGMSAERQRLLNEDSFLQTLYNDLAKAEADLMTEHVRVDKEKNAEWKRILDALSEENYRIEEAWQDLADQEAIVNRRLETGDFTSDEERLDCENDRDQLLQAHALLKDEEERVAAAQQKEMERVETEMEKWTQQKEHAMAAIERQRNDLLRQQGKEIGGLMAQVEAKVQEVKVQQEKCYGADRLLRSLQEDIKKQVGDLLEEQKGLADLKERKSQEQAASQEDREREKEHLQCRLQEAEEAGQQEILRIAQERQRLVGLREKLDSDSGVEDDVSSSAAQTLMLEQQKELDQKIQECECLQEEIKALQEEMSGLRRQHEEDQDRQTDSIEFKKLQLQELERQERFTLFSINALVEQEVKRRLFEEKVEREKQRRVEREKERQEREQEIQRLKTQHEREMRLLRAKLDDSNGISKASPYGNFGSSESLADNRRKLVKQLSSTCPSYILEVSVPNYALHGSGRDTHYEYEVKVKIGDEVWSVFRRYSRFREMHQLMRKKYPAVEVLIFPPRKLFHKSERVAAERRVLLEQYLKSLVEVCQRSKECPLHPDNHQFLTKHVLADFDPFFRRGLFEPARHIAS